MVKMPINCLTYQLLAHIGIYFRKIDELFQKAKFINSRAYLFCNYFLFVLLTLFLKVFTHGVEPDLRPFQNLEWRPL